MTEAEVKQAVGNNLDNIAPDQFILLSTLIHELKPEDRLRIVEQIPAFTEVAKAALNIIQTSLAEADAANRESTGAYFSMVNTAIAACRDVLQCEGLTFAEKQEVLDRIERLTKMAGDKDTENKRFNWNKLSVGITAGVTVFSVVACIFGFNIKFPRLRG